jgi:hypothetical protein
MRDLEASAHERSSEKREPYERVQTALFCSRDTPYDHRGK